MSQFYIARFRADPLIHGVPFEPVEGQELASSAVIALAVHTERDLNEPWEIRIAGPFNMGPERIELLNPKEHIL